jgi:hypothetical protein
MVIVELTQRGIKKIYVQHAAEEEEIADFKALQFAKPRLMAMHAALKEHFHKEKGKNV